mmetsp:Transcript_30143/g.56550  ORF Transcript_30143/g.56550 Transcript_30143/m.56550 type:complete len:122 (+) Transcript_30143:440-805(+)
MTAFIEPGENRSNMARRAVTLVSGNLFISVLTVPPTNLFLVDGRVAAWARAKPSVAPAPNTGAAVVATGAAEVLAASRCPRKGPFEAVAANPKLSEMHQAPAAVAATAAPSMEDSLDVISR